MSKDDEIRRLLNEGMSYRNIVKNLNCSKATISKVKKSINDKEDLGSQVQLEISKLNLTSEELKNLLKQIKTKEINKNTYEHFYDEKHVKIGLITDTHIGSKYFNYSLFDKSVKAFDKEKVDAIYHAGDVIEGMSNREGHIYELEIIGTNNQIRHANELLSQYKQPLFFITGNHDEWSSKKSNQGLELGELLQQYNNNLQFIGKYVADIKLSDNVKLRITHEGNTAYALSYSIQKRINAISGGDKPEILFNGHLHKAITMMYRNIYAMEGACFQAQTPFMREKGSPAMMGFYILDIYYNKKGITSIDNKFYPAYE